MKGMCVILFVFLIYYTYCLHVTKDIMDKANKVAQGKILVESRTPYAGFKETRDIKRIFTYCGLKKGRIYVTCIDIYADKSSGKIYESRDWFYIEIEKVDGEWEAVRCVGEP